MKNTHVISPDNTTKNQSSQLPLVAILMGTYNGALYLSEQLDSLEKQTYKNWRLITSDDGSTDETLEILKSYQARWLPGQLDIRRGPQKGFCQNFLSLSCDPGIQADYYAFCDQDDVWLPEKLAVSLDIIQCNEKLETAYIYCGRTSYVDEKCKPCGISPLFKRPKVFANALVQSIAGGNTMVFNRTSKSLLERAGSLTVVSHDWWLYQLVTGAGGEVFYDANPYLLYRQHEKALVGGNTSLFAKYRRMVLVFEGRFKSWNNQNIEALNHVRNLLIPKNAELVDFFEKARSSNLISRLVYINTNSIYRQTLLGSISLKFALVLKKI